MRTVSVKEAAAALGLTERAIIYRLDKGQLKGTQSPNNFGKPQWRVYPTKEISDGLKQLNIQEEPEQASDGSINFEPGDHQAEDVTDAHVVDSEASNEESTTDASVGNRPGPQEWQDLAKDTLKGLAEELVRPLGETIKSQQDMLREQQDIIAEKEKVIEEKDRQLKLLPDLEKRAEREREEAEEQRKAAQLAALEAEALKKQIDALEKERTNQEEKIKDLSSLADQVVGLTQQVEKLQEPWWKKWFSPVDHE